MRTTIAIVCLALLVGANPAGAQQTYFLSVSRHRSVHITGKRVDQILAAASRMLQKPHGPGVACNITFKRIGPVHTFASPYTPAVIKTESDRDAVHTENFDPSVINVQVVKKIDFCRPQQGNSFLGCSWPHHFRSIIVVAHQRFPKLVWPHEFGHQTGLWHRQDGAHALMSPCVLEATNVQVNNYECSCLLSGPGTCENSRAESSCGMRVYQTA